MLQKREMLWGFSERYDFWSEAGASGKEMVRGQHWGLLGDY